MFNMEENYKIYLEAIQNNPQAAYFIKNNKYIVQKVSIEEYDFIKNFKLIDLKRSKKDTTEIYNLFKDNALFIIKIFELYFKEDILETYVYENFISNLVSDENTKSFLNQHSSKFDPNTEKYFLIPLDVITRCVQKLFKEGISQNTPQKQVNRYLESNKESTPVGLRVRGGYIKNLASPKTVFKFNEKSFNVDIDIDGAYTSSQKYMADFPFGAEPLSIKDKKASDKRLKEQINDEKNLWEIYNKYILNCVDGIKYYANCILPYENNLNGEIDNIFLSSYELHSKEIRILDYRATKDNKKVLQELMEVSDKVSRTAIYKKELGGYYEKGKDSNQKGVLIIHLDHFSLQYLRALYGVKKFELLLKNLKVLNFVYYDKANCTNDLKDVFIDMTIKKIANNEYNTSMKQNSGISIDEFKETYGLKGKKDTLQKQLLEKFGYRKLFFNIAVKDLITKTVAESRAENKKKSKSREISEEDKNKYNVYQLIEKLFLNSFYGACVSPYFDWSNTVIGNLITSPVRAYTYTMSLIFNGKTAITDGAVFDLFKSIKAIPRGDKTLKTIVKTLDKIQNANYFNNREEFLENLSLKEDLPFGIKKIEYIGNIDEGFIKITHNCLNKDFNSIQCYENSDLVTETYNICEEDFKKIISKAIKLHLIKYLGSEEKKNNLNKCLMSNKIDGSLDIINSNMFNIDVKGVFKDFVTHSMANYYGTGWYKYNNIKNEYDKSHPYVDEPKYRGISAKSREKYLKDFFISAIENQNAVRRVKPFLDNKILSFESARTSGPIYKIISDKSIPYKERMYKLMDYCVDNNFGGGDIEIIKVFKEFSLGTFNFLSKHQEDDWLYYVNQLNKYYGQSLEIFFLNPDNTLRYAEMNEKIGNLINEGRNFVDSVKIISKKSYKQIWGLSNQIANIILSSTNERLEKIEVDNETQKLITEICKNENIDLKTLYENFLKIKCKEGFYDLFYVEKNDYISDEEQAQEDFFNDFM